ncbi:hypothetical protein M404DRAFT_999587 [Pisolithus tinctorius Marx 270]|uniref:Uncharacterized protein n=1 Tax=Pisolithus tinctorius Marx 270 TaxID=870435 RepID=A0A0C3PDL3_PISTI|nr:hypothetical protein M404DRAFT_999587 [Pisolithus tinctorius Marx 270]
MSVIMFLAPTNLMFRLTATSGSTRQSLGRQPPSVAYRLLFLATVKWIDERL